MFVTRVQFRSRQPAPVVEPTPNMEPTTKSAAPVKEKTSQEEIDTLKAELRGMEILLQQNAALESEVERLNGELDEATSGVQKRGYLYKWREREIYYAAKWGLRYFVLQGNKISYYGNDHENRPRRTIDLSNCYVRDEGKKKGYHIFSIYLGSTTATDADNPLDSSLLLRMSSESSAEAMLWIDMLEQGCVVNDGSFPPLNTPSASFVTSELSPTTPNETVSTSDSNGTSCKKFTFDGVGGLEKEASTEDWGHPHVVLRSNDDLANLAVEAEKASVQIPMVTLTRVRSSTKVLQKSQSRQTFARRILSSRAPQALDRSGPPTPTRSPSGRIAAPKRTTGKGIHKSFPAFKPMHVMAQTSPLSPDISKADHNFRGFFNLGVIILLISHAEMIINNLMKYGFKASLPFVYWTTANIAEVSDSSFTLEYITLAFSTWAGSILLSFLVEKVAANNQVPERVILGVNYVLGITNIVLPCVLVWRCKAHPGANMLYLLQSVIIWMKLISYAHANRGLRRSSRKIKKADKDDSTASNSGQTSSVAAPVGLGSRQSSGDDLYTDNNAKPYSDQMALMLAECKDLQPPFLLYPQNISLSNLLYFMVAPTLCYQLNYPRIPKIRWSKVFFLVFRMIFVAAITIFAVEQYMIPTLETSLAPMENRDVLMIIERLLKLSIPNTYVWLLGFYFFFHLWLNLLGELTRFGDRLFYKEWWNARTIDEYW